MVLEELKHTFRPEFLNRIDDIIVFQKLTEDEIRTIAKNMLDQLAQRVEQMGYHLLFTDKAVTAVAKAGYDPVFGARPLRRLEKGAAKARGLAAKACGKLAKLKK